MLSRQAFFVFLVCGVALVTIMISELRFYRVVRKTHTVAMIQTSSPAQARKFNHVRKVASMSHTDKTDNTRLLSRVSHKKRRGNFTLGYTMKNRAVVKIYDYLPVNETEEEKERRFDQIRTWLKDLPKRNPEVIPKCENVTKRILWFDIWHDKGVSKWHNGTERNWNGIRNPCEKGKVDFSKCRCRCEVDFFLFDDTDKLYEPTSGDAVLFQLQHLRRMGHPPVKHNGQVFVGVSKEPYISRSKFLKNFEYVFNWTMTFRKDSEIFYPYGRIKKRIGKAPAKNYSDIYRKKKKGIVWFVSHCITKSKREDYAKELGKYIDIDIIGKCGSDICGRYDDCTEKIAEEYFFRFNVENSFHTDYVSEKLFENFPKDMIQIVGGSADYDSLVPPKTVIDINRFDSPADLADYLKLLMTSEVHFTNILKRKDEYYAESYADQIQGAYCELCDKLHEPERYRNLYYNIADWFKS